MQEPSLLLCWPSCALPLCCGFHPQAIRRTARHLDDVGVLPAAASGIGTLCGALAEGDGAAALRQLLLPLLTSSSDLLASAGEAHLMGLGSTPVSARKALG